MTANVKPDGTEISSRAAAAAQVVIPLALVAYLAFAGGGYDGIVYGQVGILCWTALLLGAIVGILPAARQSRGALAVLALLAALTLWTAIGISWSESSERSVLELLRVGSFLGIFALALAIQGPGGIRRAVLGVGAAIAIVGSFALMSRFHPELFPEIEAARFLDDIEARLSYPLNYWNGLAALMAIGVPLLLSIALSARGVAARAVAAAFVPVLALTSFFTLSRGGLLSIAVALIVFIAFCPRRFAALPSIGLAVLGSAILIALGSTKDALQDGLSDSAAISQGNELLLFTVIICALVGAGHVLLSRSMEHREGPRISPRAGLAIAGGLAAVAIVGAIAVGAPGKISDRLDEFTEAEAPDPTAGASRYESLSGNGRYQLWASAVNAGETNLLTGIGPGTYEFWWTEDRPIDSYAKTAHSLYLNALAELGIIGMLLTIALVLVPLGVAIAHWTRAGPERLAYAGAIAGMATFAVAAGIDRTWDLAVLPAAFLLLAAAATSPPRSGGEVEVDEEPPSGSVRVAIAIAVPAAILVLAVPTAGLLKIRGSQEDFRAGDVAGALERAREAKDLQPYAATPFYQEALLLETEGELDAAAAAARAATERESTNWRTWFVLARIEDQRGDEAAAEAALDEVRNLNPLSDLLR